MSDLQGRVISSLRWQALAKVGSQVVSWGSTIVVMRLLAPADYGLMAMAMVLVGLTSLIAEMGLGSAIVQSPNVDLLQQRRVFGLSILVNCGIYAALAIASPLASKFFSEPQLVPLILVLGLQLPLAALTVVPESMARRELHFKSLSIIEMLVQVTAAGTTLACAALGWGTWALVAGQLLSTLLKCAVMMSYMGVVRPSFAMAGQGSLLRFGGTLTVNRIVWYFFAQADVFIAGRMLGAQSLGVYSVAVNLANMPMHKIMSVSNQVAFSALARLSDNREARNQALLRSLQMIAVVAVALLWGLLAVAPELIPLLLGEKWLPAILPLQVIALVVPLRVVSAMLSTALIAAGNVGEDLKNTLTGAALLVPGFIVGAAWGGVNGIAFAWAVCFPLFAAILTHRAAKRLGFGALAVVRYLRQPVIAGVAMILAAAALRQYGAGLGAGLLLVGEILLAGVAYVVCLWLMDRRILVEMSALVRPTAAKQ